MTHCRGKKRASMTAWLGDGLAMADRQLGQRALRSMYATTPLVERTQSAMTRTRSCGSDAHSGSAFLLPPVCSFLPVTGVAHRLALHRDRRGAVSSLAVQWRDEEEAPLQ
jgi:hypothetical protein